MKALTDENNSKEPNPAKNRFLVRELSVDGLPSIDIRDGCKSSARLIAGVLQSSGDENDGLRCREVENSYRPDDFEKSRNETKFRGRQSKSRD